MCLSFTVTLSPASELTTRGRCLATATATGTITDNHDPLSVSLSVAEPVVEGSSETSR